MATRTPYPGTAADPDVLTAANFNKLPGGIFAYATTTSSQTGITTTTGLVNVTFTAPGSRLYLITGRIGAIDQQTTPGLVKVRLFEGLTGLGTIFNTTLGSNERAAVTGSVLHTPASGSRTYSITLETSAGTVDMAANTNDPGPCSIWVWDAGPSF